MQDSLSQLVVYIVQLGVGGVLLLAALDSSILFLPFAVDLLVLTASANSGWSAVLYAIAAAAGSVAGTAILYTLAQKGGEKGLQRFGNSKRIEAAKKKLKDNASVPLALAGAMPPPFPYRVPVAVAAALSFPRGKALAITGASRFVRFGAEAILGVFYGREIKSFMQTSDVFYYSLLALGVISVVASIGAIALWIMRGRKA